MAHSHGHSYGKRVADAGRDRSASRRRLLWALGLAACFMLAEVVGGVLANSLALLADAGHMLSDVAGLAS